MDKFYIISGIIFIIIIISIHIKIIINFKNRKENNKYGYNLRERKCRDI